MAWEQRRAKQLRRALLGWQQWLAFHLVRKEQLRLALRLGWHHYAGQAFREWQSFW